MQPPPGTLMIFPSQIRTAYVHPMPDRCRTVMVSALNKAVLAKIRASDIRSYRSASAVYLTASSETSQTASAGVSSNAGPSSGTGVYIDGPPGSDRIFKVSPRWIIAYLVLAVGNISNTHSLSF